MEEKLQLYGFNNLTKSLSFNIYDICYAKSQREQQDYIKYIDEQYNSERLRKILSKVTEMIGARILHMSSQDYEPRGASVTLLVAEEAAVASGKKIPLAKAKSLHISIKVTSLFTHIRNFILKRALQRFELISTLPRAEKFHRFERWIF